MSASASVRVESGVGSLALRAGPLEVTVVPERAMTASSVVYRGERYGGAGPVVLPGPDVGVGNGLPLMHPWANRLSADRFEVGGPGAGDGPVEVDLRNAPHVFRDGRGAPIHGTCLGVEGWDVTWLEVDEEGDGVVVEGVLAFDQRGDLLASFPFPHRLQVRWEVLDAGHPDGGDHPMARCTTAVVPMGEAKVPVAFGWHPFLQLPGAGRAQWRVVLPEREHLLLDEAGFPTGEELYLPAEAEPLGLRTFDDSFRLGTHRDVGLTCGERWLALSLDEGYTYLQVYTPPGGETIALEPMTAPVDALVRGTHLTAEGRPVAASFTLSCG